MKVGLLGQFGSGNTGNDGSLEAMLNFLRASRPDAELICICSNPKAVTEHYDVDAISIGGIPDRGPKFNQINRLLGGIPRRLLSFRAALNQLKGTDLVIVPGTGILDDFQETAFGWPFVILRWCLAARLRNASIAFVSIGAGPITQPLSRLFLKTGARMAGYRSYRDDLSRDFMKSIGFDVRRDPVSADLAFALPPADEPVVPAGHDVRVGVGVMSYSGWKKAGEKGELIYRTYLKKLETLITWMHERGLEVRLLTGDSVDRQAVTDIMKMIDSHDLADGPRIIAEEMTSLHDVMAQIAQTDIVVATRYHNVVCALRMERPVISIGYAEKNNALLGATGLSEYCHHVETFDVDVLKQQVTRMLADRTRLAGEVKRGVAVFHAKLAEQEAVIRGKLGDPPALKPAVKSAA
ncbi:MAG: polysaccharide pyruvyl transferase family protein [Phyllobacterium sp.]|uniref:polysaccharide pyruvyl transferase family protein n=1 Tax=Phyllobacterium sp. TaxID=1871046 RepID=UPI0030F118A7